MNISPNVNKKMSGYQNIELSNFNFSIVPSEYVYGGPSNQYAFFEELLSMQFEGSLLQDTKETEELIQILSRLSLISYYLLDGECFETTQHSLETRRKIDKHWNTNYGPHGWHRYIGRFPPQLVRAIINYFGATKEHKILDPFCGSGTTLVEARLLNVPALGIEICPLSALISRSKSKFEENTDLIVNTLSHFKSEYEKTWNHYFQEGNDLSYNSILGASFNHIEKFPNIEKWFTPEALLGASIAFDIILRIQDDEIRDLFLLALSSSMRGIGNIDVDVVRAEYRKIPRKNVDVAKHLQSKIKRYISDIKTIENVYGATLASKESIHVIQEDVRKAHIEDNSIDYIITSPPYGIESSSYLRTHLLSYRILKEVLKEDPYDFGNSVIGSEYINENGNNRIKIPKELIGTHMTEFFNKMINSENRKEANRAEQMLQFFIDMHEVSKQFSTWLKPSGKIAFVIGNKKIGNTIIPTDIFIEQIFKENGLILRKKLQHKLKCNNTNSKVPWEERVISEEFILFFDKVI